MWDIVLFSVFLILVGGTCVNGEKSQCDVIAARVALENQNTIVDTTTKRLFGTWMSEGCEMKPGPEYILRRYTFKSDASFIAIQHHYWDSSCSTPKFSLISYGFFRLKQDLLLNLDAASGHFKISNITLIPQDIKAIKELEDMLSLECPSNTWKSWRRYEEHRIFEANEQSNSKRSNYFNSNIQPQTFSTNQNLINTQRHLTQRSGDINCMGSLKWAFNELKLLKIQFRPIMSGSLDNTFKQFRLELLLGDTHSRYDQRENYIPTSFNVPLLKHIRNDENIITTNGKNFTVENVCNICSNLYSGDKSPPHLFEKPHLPPYIWGEWTSLRCEIRPMGLYLTRKFFFYSDDSSWIGEHKFYQDPFCIIPKFIVTAAGQYMLTSASSVITGATNIDFKIERASLTLFNKRMVHEMRLYNTCGQQKWDLGVPQELSATHGCLQLGIIIPSIQFDIVKVDMNYEGACLLYLGQVDTDNMLRSSNERPTAFQLPMIKCGDAERYSDSFGDIVDESSYYDEIVYSGCVCSYNSNYIKILILMVSVLVVNR